MHVDPFPKLKKIRTLRSFKISEINFPNLNKVIFFIGHTDLWFCPLIVHKTVL